MDALIFICLMLIGGIFLSDGLFMNIWTIIKKYIFKENKDDYSWFYIDDIC